MIIVKNKCDRLFRGGHCHSHKTMGMYSYYTLKQQALIGIAIGITVLACSNFLPRYPVAIAVPTATRLPTAIYAPSTFDLGAQEVTVIGDFVWIRNAPAGDKIGYVEKGQIIRIANCKDNWCMVEKPAGWIWAGCVDAFQHMLDCQTMP